MPRKRPIMTSDHADKMEITVVFQCPPKGKERHTSPSNTAGMSSRPLGTGYYCEGLLLPYRTKRKWRTTQKDLQLFRASPYAPEWSGNIHESKLSDIHRPIPSRLPMGRLKSYKYKKSAYGGKKSPACAGKKGLAHRCYALHDNQEYMGSCFCTSESRTF